MPTRFSLPPSRLDSLDEILVWSHLSALRYGQSARVAVDRFNLIQ